MKTITVNWFEGSRYWEVLFDGKQVYTSQDKRDAQLFAAELLARLDNAGIICQ